MFSAAAFEVSLSKPLPSHVSSFLNSPNSVPNKFMTSANYTAGYPPQPDYSGLHLLACSGEYASGYGLLETASLAEINQADHNGNTPLMWAACAGRNDVLEQLLDSGADVNQQNFSGQTALHLAAGAGNARGCELLLLAGADWKVCDCDGLIAAHSAAASGCVEVLRVLFNYGVNLNAIDFEEETPLFHAVRENQRPAVEYLVTECKASTLTCNEDGETALDIAMVSEDTDMLQFLAKYAGAATAASIVREQGITAEQPQSESMVLDAESSAHKLPGFSSGSSSELPHGGTLSVPMFAV